ncbi:nucleoside kinase, partial [Candidatus Sumerlaeota bacterium]|nr:nucleoside kinase [Candidatus Sumerlaeota bacterium]
TYDHFYGILAPSTGSVRLFDIKPYPPGFILRFPSIEDPTRLPKFIEQKKMFQVYQEYEEWGRLLGIRNVADLNRRIKEGNIKEIILTAEALHEKRIAQIADMINERKQVRVVLNSGPSSSGKTTFSHRLAVQLNVVGRRSFTVHLDNYFVDRERTPRTESGELDFESLEAINIKLFQRHLSKLLAGESVQLPVYNFRKGKSERGERVKLDKNTIIIVEGIHGLNEKLTEHIPEAMKFKIYVSAFAQLNLDEHNRISTSDVRVLRRLIRDNQYRGYSPVETIRRWSMVRRGEEQHIFPYQESADVMFNSALIYELSVLRTFSEPWLKKIPPSEEVYSEARRLLKFTSYFLPVSESCVPPTSILREFIGKSCFEELRSLESTS